MESKKIAKSFSKQLKKNATRAEKRLKKKLIEANIPFYFQKPVAKNTYKEGFYIPDFTIPVRHTKFFNLYIEIDGGYHSVKEQKIKDQQRERFLKKGKHRLIRFTNADIYGNIYKVIKKIEHIIKPE